MYRGDYIKTPGGGATEIYARGRLVPTLPDQLDPAAVFD
jgi:hypothetical protein